MKFPLVSEALCSRFSDVSFYRSCIFVWREERGGSLLRDLAMGQNPIPPVNVPIPTKIGSKMGGEFMYPKMGSKTVLTTTAVFGLQGGGLQAAPGALRARHRCAGGEAEANVTWESAGKVVGSTRVWGNKGLSLN